jgi:hypothetical protein
LIPLISLAQTAPLEAVPSSSWAPAMAGGPGRLAGPDVLVMRCWVWWFLSGLLTRCSFLNRPCLVSCLSPRRLGIRCSQILGRGCRNWRISWCILRCQGAAFRTFFSGGCWIRIWTPSWPWPVGGRKRKDYFLWHHFRHSSHG